MRTRCPACGTTLSLDAKLFLDNLGNRDPPKALPEPPITTEARERNRARLKEIAQSLAKRKGMSN